jgi:oxygen-independent coproporphyrinogen III oxidase
MELRYASGDQLPGADPNIAAFVKEQLEKVLHIPPGNKILANHPSFSLLSPDPVPLDEILNEHSRAPKPHRILYVSLPFCLPTSPGSCGFCLFPKVDLENRSNIGTYLDYIRRELDLITPHIVVRDVDAIFFGGGTPNLLNAEESGQYVSLIRKYFNLKPGGEITFEGIPQLYTTEDKFKALKDAGVTRISIGVQQIQDHLIALSGRKQKRDHVIKALEWINKYDLNHSLDLIYGWPTQTFDDALNDIQTLMDWNVPHITSYPLNVLKDLTAFSRPPLNEKVPQISEFTRMYREIRSLLLANGYQQRTMSDYEKSDRTSSFAYETLSHDPMRCDIYAIGYSGGFRICGLPENPGFGYITPHVLNKYYEQIDQGQIPYRAGIHYGVEDLELVYICNQLQENQLDRGDYKKWFDKDVVDQFLPIWQAFLDLGWVEICPDTVQLVDLGVFYSAHLQRALSYQRNQELKEKQALEGYNAQNGI